MDAEKQRLKEFLEEHIPFKELKQAGFFAKDVKRTDYEKIAERICWYFGFKNVYEYGHGLEMIRVSDTVVAGGFSDTVDKTGNLNIGDSFHIDICQTEFTCPICTCEQDAAENKKFNKPKSMVVTIKCKGCKRPLRLFTDQSGRLHVTEEKMS